MDFLIHHMLRTSANRFSDKDAMVHGNRRLSYEQAARQTAGLAHGLRAAGVGRSDRVGIYLEPSIAQSLSILGVSQSGGAFVPIHHSLFPNQTAHIVRDCEMKGLVADSRRLEQLRPVLGGLTSLEFLIVVDAEEDHEFHLPTYDFAELTETGDPVANDDVAIEKDLAAILYTSGSTGAPKGIMLSHANVMAGASIVSTYLDLSGYHRCRPHSGDLAIQF
jgi:acyl-CoA synthetase (AMP-forming)/AMP-acid ligase II